jgi:hypothetical protein
MLRNPEIGFWGGMALLVSSITGPGLTTGNPLEQDVLTAHSSSNLPTIWLASVCSFSRLSIHFDSVYVGRFSDLRGLAFYLPPRHCSWLNPCPTFEEIRDLKRELNSLLSLNYTLAGNRTTFCKSYYILHCRASTFRASLFLVRSVLRPA